MRVLIDTSYAARGFSGTAVYIRELVRALRQRGNVEVVEAIQTRRMARGRSGARWNPLRSGANALLDFDWLHRGLPRAARGAGADVVHHPLPAWSGRIAVPQAITVHDVAFAVMPERFDPVWARLAGRQHARAARGAGAVICVSRATAEDAERLLGAPRERVVIAPHGPGQGLPRVERAERPDHLLYVGDAEPRKGLEALLAAHARIDDAPELVLVGAAAAAASQPRVRGEGQASPRRLAELHAGAAALVHPSLHEGFGLTLLEAMTVGTPVVAVRNAAVEEVCGDAALLVGEGELADAVGRVARDPELRSRLSEAGRRRAAEFSWSRSAEAHERAYELAASAAGGVRVRAR